MIFKLLFFVVIGIGSINLSIIKNQPIDGENFVRINNFGLESVNTFENDAEINRKDPFQFIEYLNFNKSDFIITSNGMKIPEVKCVTYPNQKNCFCKIGNGKYQAQTIECVNVNYPKSIPKFECKLFGAKEVSRNVVFNKDSKFTIGCRPDVTQENAKGRCAILYSFNDLD